ncbi:hypothetical protein MD484_g1452, partial [Candolleomyces efflorescens]
MNVLSGSQNARVEYMTNYNVEGTLHFPSLPISPEQRTLYNILQPIIDASHTRDRKRSPPNSDFFPGTRPGLVTNVNGWTRGKISHVLEPHVRWMYGYVGSGKSSISQEVCDTCEREDRPVISFFFFRNAGDRSRIWRLATTLASQMAVAVPEAGPFIRAAVESNPALLAPNEGGISLRARMQQLVYATFKAAVQGERGADDQVPNTDAPLSPVNRALSQSPLLIVLDGLDECENKDEIQELISGMLLFFKENPLIPLRVFITSRVEEHIQSQLNVPSVRLDNLVDYCSDDDIDTFLRLLFEDGCKRSAVIRSYVQQHGEWPTPSDRRKLVEHIGGSFIFGSTLFKFIMGTNTEGDAGTSMEAGAGMTPMDRLPLALKMNPGLDGLYAQILARSQHLPHFGKIISTIALLQAPLSTSGIAEILGINTYEVVNVLVNVQTIIQVPGTDDIPVTLCHTSLRDFLTTQSRSHEFFAHPSNHVLLHRRCIECKLKHLRQDPGLFMQPRRSLPPAACYAVRYSRRHSWFGSGGYTLSDLNSAIELCREGLALQPEEPELKEDLASIVRLRGIKHGYLADIDEAISLCRAVLDLRQTPHPGYTDALNSLATALLARHRRTGVMADLEEAISLYSEALKLRPIPHSDRAYLLNSLGSALLDRHRWTGIVADLDEATSLLREALELRPSPHPGRSHSLNTLGNALLDRHRRTGVMADLEDATALYREALELRPFPHPGRSNPLNNLGNALLDCHRRTGVIADLEGAISLYNEALELRPSPHPDRSDSLNNLGNALLDRHRRAGVMTDLEKAISLLREALKLRPSPHPDRSDSLNNLGNALLDRYRRTGVMADLEEAVSFLREALELRPSPRLNRPDSLNNLGNALVDRHRCTGVMADLEEAISLLREALEFRPSPHPDRSDSFNNLGNALLDRHRCTGVMADLEEAVSLLREALDLRPSPRPDRPDVLYNLALSLHVMYKVTHVPSDLQEAVTCREELVELHRAVGHRHRPEALIGLAELLQMRFDVGGQEEDLSRIEALREEAKQLSVSLTESTG